VIIYDAAMLEEVNRLHAQAIGELRRLEQGHLSEGPSH
jgi:hypothetical protein